MEKFFSVLNLIHNKLDKVYNFFQKKLLPFLSHAFEYILFEINPFCHHLFYYLILSTLGYFALKATKQSSPVSLTQNYDDLDLFFTSISATTISSMSTVEMEDFSNTQLVILVFLMLSGGEVFISFLGLQIRKLKHKRRARKAMLDSSPYSQDEGMKYRSLRALGHVVFGYLLVSHIIGYVLVSLYISLAPSASNVLKKKGIELHLFSLFTTISTFSNCGFLPTNENMIPFKKNSGLLLILIPQILMGNKLYPSCLRLVIWALEKLTRKDEFRYMLNHHGGLGYGLLTSKFYAMMLTITAIGLIMVQFVVFCILEWKNSLVMEGFNWYQKLVGSLFQTVNSRHSGESIVDLSLLSSATLVLFLVMMFLPSYTTFVPIGYDKETSVDKARKRKTSSSIIAENLKFSPLSYLAIFVMVICITEWKSLQDDPLNFNVFNIVLEVVRYKIKTLPTKYYKRRIKLLRATAAYITIITCVCSAYGNVGFSTGYSCERRLERIRRQPCKDSWYGFVGRWSNEGKLVLILVMIFGKLKRFSFDAGKAWKLSF